MPDPVLLTDDVRVDYGDTTAVADLSFAIGPGEVMGLIGPNGAGKTSTIRVLATLLEPTYGQVLIGGHDPAASADQAAAARAILGYMPDLAPVHDDITCVEFLDSFAGAYGLRGKQRKARVDECLALVQLEAKRKAMASSLSRGMTQRLVLAKTLLHKPAVMLLDEPASGLDPLARAQLRDLINQLAAEGVAVLISSHILTELSGFCTVVGIMERGRLKRFGKLDELTAAMRQRRVIDLELLDEPELFLTTLRAQPRVENLQTHQQHITFDLLGDDRDAARLLATLVAAGLPIVGFTERKPGIEELLRESGATEVS